MALVLLPITSVYAARSHPQSWLLCQPDELADAVRPYTGAPKNLPYQVQADRGESSATEATLDGHVQVDQGDRRLQADKVLLDRQTNRARSEGGVAVYGDPDIAMRSAAADLDMDNNVGVFKQADYYFPERNAQGSAEQATTERDSKQTHLEQATYSTCTRGEEEWQVRARKLDLNQATGRGVAHDMSLAISGVPILYFPYMSFPINNKRQSGFLAPTLGYDNDSGLDLRVPYYWNIAPNQDMTISPRILAKRGVQLGVEYRFLRSWDRGIVRLEYLPNDRVFGADRDAEFVSYQANLRPSLSTNLLFQHVSDDLYRTDLDNNIDLLSPSSLERHLDLYYNGGDWNAMARVQNFQTINKVVFTSPESKPYSRLPQLLFNGAWDQRFGGLSYKLRSELVNFDRAKTVTGTRFDIQPGVSLPLSTSAAFLAPSLSYRYTAYELRDTAPGAATSPTRGAPIFSTDAGLFFERTLQGAWWGGSGIQTLEPRLFYLYVPFRHQDNIPVFDSTNVDPGYSLLFLENRFTGADRLGDANQLTAALTTRFLSAQDGRERLRASVGQIYYFRTPRVTLDGTPTTDESRLDTVAEALFYVTPEWSLGGSTQWDTAWNNTRRNLDIRYFVDEGRLFNVSYRFAEDKLEQLDLSLIWPVTDQWRTLARWNYSLLQDRSLDVFAGFEYDTCCWALRMLARQRRDNPDDIRTKNSVLVEMELKGLAGVGASIDKVLKDTILGHEITH